MGNSAISEAAAGAVEIFLGAARFVWKFDGIALNFWTEDQCRGL